MVRMLKTSLTCTFLFLASCASPPTQKEPDIAQEDLSSTPIVIADQLPVWVPKGYVEFYYFKSEGNPIAPTTFHRIECNEELLLARLPSSWLFRDKVGIRISSPPGTYLYRIRKGTAKVVAKLSVGRGMITPVRIRFENVETEENRAEQTLKTSFSMILTVEKQRPLELDTTPLEPSKGVNETEEVVPSPAQEVAEALMGLHTAMEAQNLEELIQQHSDIYGRRVRADQPALRNCYGNLIAQDILRRTEVSTEKCYIAVEGETATAGPIVYDTPHMDEVWRHHRLRREADGRWRLTHEGDVSQFVTGFENEGPMCIPIRKKAFVPKEALRLYNSIGMVFAYVKPGWFKMGSPPYELGSDEDEWRHRVKLTQGFYMQTTEVTQGQWKAVMGMDPSAFLDCGDDCPVERVSWCDTQRFIEALNQLEQGVEYRLPTEAEWEYAARAGRSSRFCFGDSEGRLGRYAWYRWNSRNTTHPVGKKRPNEWGIYDLHGNVLEWCQDWYGSYPSRLVINPTGPEDGLHRVIRGGSWYDDSHDVRSANRGCEPPDYSFLNVGFRLVRDMPSEDTE